MQPKISAIVLTKNRAEWLPRLVQILRAQTWKNLEIIIAEREDKGVHADLPPTPNLTHLKMGRAGWVERNRVAMMLATGTIIAIIDDDDYFSPTRIERQAEEILSGGCSMNGMTRATLHTVYIPEMKWGRLSWVKRTDGTIPPDPDRGILPPLCCSDGTVMFRRDKFQGAKDPALHRQKIPFLRTILRRCTFGYMDGTELYAYARHNSNLSGLNTIDWSFVEGPAPNFVPREQVEFWKRMVERVA